MAALRITKAARKDLVEIARFTLVRWGNEQRIRYLSQLDARFRLLAKRPELGLPSDHVKPGYLRSLEGRHVIFYRVVNKRVEIVRVLHQRMLPKRHL